MHFTTFSLFLVSVLVGLSKTSLDHNQFTEKASLCPCIYIIYPHHTEVSLLRQWSERSCICVLGFIDFASFYDFDMWFWNCSDCVVFFISLFYFRLIEANCDVYRIALSLSTSIYYQSTCLCIDSIFTWIVTIKALCVYCWIWCIPDVYDWVKVYRNFDS